MNWIFLINFIFSYKPLKWNTSLLQAREGIELGVLQSYCWMYSSLRIPREFRGACSSGDSGEVDTRSSIVYNTYYQWVPLYLIFIAFLFYLPRMFWLSMEGGIMKFLCKGTTTRWLHYTLHVYPTRSFLFPINRGNKLRVGYKWEFKLDICLLQEM